MAQRITETRRHPVSTHDASVNLTRQVLTRAREKVMASTSLTDNAREVAELFICRFGEMEGELNSENRLTATQVSTEHTLRTLDNERRKKLRPSIRSGIETAKWALRGAIQASQRRARHAAQPRKSARDKGRRRTV